MFYIRAFKIGDEEDIYQLFYDTVHTINRRDYSEQQLDIWAPEFPDIIKWQRTLSTNYTFVAIDPNDDKIIGFSDLEKNGYLNRGYVHKDYQRQGIGTALLKVREVKAKELGIIQLVTDASITARDFFEKHGYVLVLEQSKILGGVPFINYHMTKDL